MTEESLRMINKVGFREAEESGESWKSEAISAMVQCRSDSHVGVTGHR